MKIIKTLTVLFVVSLLFFSCASNKQIDDPVTADEYSDEVTEVDSEENENVTESKKTSSTAKNTATKKKKSSFSLASLFASKFYEYDNSSLFSSGVFGGLKQQNASIVYHPKSNNIGFGSPILAAYYYALFDSDARAKLSKAVDAYLNDFDNKRLDRKGKKTYKAYGKINSTLYWGTIKSSTPNNGSGEFYAGYLFEKNSPYFVLKMFPIDNKIYTSENDTAPKESITLTFYFTKAQAKALSNLLTDEKALEVARKYDLETYGDDEVYDTYVDDYEVTGE